MASEPDRTQSRTSEPVAKLSKFLSCGSGRIASWHHACDRSVVDHDRRTLRVRTDSSADVLRVGTSFEIIGSRTRHLERNYGPDTIDTLRRPTRADSQRSRTTGGMGQ